MYCRNRIPYPVCLMAVYLLLWTLFPFTAQGAEKEEDETPPVLHTVAVGQATVYPGERILISADATDDESGVESITARFSNEETGSVLSVRLLPNSDEDITLPYSGQLLVPKEAASGNYQVQSVSLKDWEGNQIRYSLIGTPVLTDNMRPAFTVSGTATSPMLTGVEIQAGKGELTVLARVQDRGTKADKISLLFENVSTGHKCTFLLDGEDGEEGRYSRRFPIPPYQPSGTYILQRATVQDALGNKTTYSARNGEDALPLLASASFQVTSGAEDTRAPVLKKVTVEQGRWKEEEFQVALSVTATDDLSGIDHISVTFCHKGTGEEVHKVLRMSDSADGSTYTAYLTLDEDVPEGIYQLDKVVLTDRAGNRIHYCRPDDVSGSKEPLPHMPAFQYRNPRGDEK